MKYSKETTDKIIESIHRSHKILLSVYEAKIGLVIPGDPTDLNEITSNEVANVLLLLDECYQSLKLLNEESL